MPPHIGPAHLVGLTMPGGQEPQLTPRTVIPPFDLLIHTVDLIVEVIGPRRLVDLGAINRPRIVFTPVVKLIGVAFAAIGTG